MWLNSGEWVPFTQPTGISSNSPSQGAGVLNFRTNNYCSPWRKTLRSKKSLSWHLSKKPWRAERGSWKLGDWYSICRILKLDCLRPLWATNLCQAMKEKSVGLPNRNQSWCWGSQLRLLHWSRRAKRNSIEKRKTQDLSVTIWTLKNIPN